MTQVLTTRMNTARKPKSAVRHQSPMQKYKAFKFGSANDFLGSHNIMAADDADAVMLAELVASDCRVDIWDGIRFVECIENQ